MKTMCRVRLVIWCCIAAAPALASEAPLFASHEPIEVTIIGPMRDLIRDRLDKERYEARLQYQGEHGETIDIPLEISARGNSRLRACDFPPIRLTFDRSVVADTVFAGQRKLKMVTLCNTRRAATSWLALEYGIYRGYNVLTDYSFRVRRLDVTFREPDSRWNRFQHAFVIEHIDDAAARLERVAVRPPKVELNQLNKWQTTLNSLYQYLIANTDFATHMGPEGEGCCHNGRILAPPGKQKDYAYLPYDFDQAGLINTDYAAPDRRLEIRSVQTRVYRGFCWHNDELDAAIALFNEKRDELLAAMMPDTLSKGKIRRATRYINRFFVTVNDAELRQQRLIDECRGPESVPIRETTEGVQ